MRVDSAVVIAFLESNVERLRDKWHRELPELRWQRAVDGLTLLPSPVPALGAHELGCRASHIAVLEEFLASDKTGLFVLEEDADFPETLFQELVWLFQTEADIYAVGHPVQPRSTKYFAGMDSRTHAYIVTRVGAQRLLENTNARLVSFNVSFSQTASQLNALLPHRQLVWQ